MAKRHYPQGGDAKAIARIAKKHFGNFEAMFKHHRWPERGADMMRKVQTRVFEAYGSVREFEAHFEGKSESVPNFNSESFNDTPIMTPEEDLFGFNNFAKAIADGIAGIENPVGSVIAIYGRWGSGKSSAVNLVQRHLDKPGLKLTVVPFQCWHYRSEDALAAGFFKELYAGLNPALSKSNKAKKAFLQLGAKISGAGPILGPIVGAATGSLGENATKSAFGALEKYIETETGNKALQDEVERTLRSHTGRFVVVLDDLDRMSTDEALVVFRLIKSVGRLPNIIYLLAYDQEVIEAAVAKEHPSEGKHYLEKIVQAGFHLPDPGQARLNEMLIKRINGIIGDGDGPDETYFQNLFDDIVAPEIQTPRDILRLTNALSVTWPAVRGEVNVADFIAMETLRLFRPKLYDAIRVRKSKLTGWSMSMDEMNPSDKAYLAILKKADKSRRGNPRTGATLKDALERLFPHDELTYSLHNLDEEARDRRVCSGSHFDTYFRFAVSGGTIPREEVQQLIDRADQEEFVKKTFLESLNVTQDRGRTKASYLLDELGYHADEIPPVRVKAFLTALFSIADELENDADRKILEFSISRRIFYLTEKLLLNCPEVEERSSILKSALKNASLECLIDVSFKAFREYNPGKGEKPKPLDKCLMTEPDVASVREQALKAIREAADDGRLIDVLNLPFVLIQWRDMAGPDSTEVDDWCNQAIEKNEFLPKLANAFLSESYHRSTGDSVSRREDRASDRIGELLDADRFRKRLKESVDNPAIPPEGRNNIRRLLNAWEAQEAGRN